MLFLEFDIGCQINLFKNLKLVITAVYCFLWKETIKMVCTAVQLSQLSKALYEGVVMSF